MKRVKAHSITALLLIGAVIVLPGHTVLAAPADDIQKGVNSVSTGSELSFDSAVSKGINTFLFIIGALAVVMIIYGGFKYVTSGGESSAVTSAKNTILYAVVGLVIAMLAYAIANFVTTKL